MIIFNNLTNSLTKVFEKFGLNENIELNLSRIDGYDLQINNLVKHNKADYFKELQIDIIEIIDNSNIFQEVLSNEIGFINLNLNNHFLLNKITNTKNDFINKKSSKIIFDYGGPNIGKPLHVGHMRTLNIGRSLYNIHSFLGNELTRKWVKMHQLCANFHS